jgi:DNA anti-recombination protein RmuC
MDLTLATLIIIIAITIAAHIAVAYYFYRRGQDGGNLGEKINDLSRQLNQQIGEQTRTMDNKLSQDSKNVKESIDNQLERVQRLLRENTKEIESVKKTSKDVLDITETLKDLEKTLSNQKKRGSLGEAGLALILENLLPPNAFQLQYSFENGEAVDAVIKAKEFDDGGCEAFVSILRQPV